MLADWSEGGKKQKRKFGSLRRVRGEKGVQEGWGAWMELWLAKRSSPSSSENSHVGRAMPGLTLYVFVYMLHCNGRAMLDLLKFVCLSGYA